MFLSIGEGGITATKTLTYLSISFHQETKVYENAENNDINCLIRIPDDPLPFTKREETFVEDFLVINSWPGDVDAVICEKGINSSRYPRKILILFDEPASTFTTATDQSQDAAEYLLG